MAITPIGPKEQEKEEVMGNSVLISTLVFVFFAPTLFARENTSLALRSQIGMPCSSNQECGGSLHCIGERETRKGAKFVGGYCVKFDCSLADPCDLGARCIEPEGRDFSLCMASCSSDTHCRNGYACRDEGVCLPAN